MRKVLEIPVHEIKPDQDSVLETQGIPPGAGLTEEVNALLEKAMDLFLEFSIPRAVISDISILEFEDVYEGQGSNEKDTPLDEILKKADSLALFAVTVGERVTKKINQLFKANDFALGSMLDSVASAGTDKAAERMENRYFDLLSEIGKITTSKGVLRFSPGYCGWHMSGQKRLFEFLRPEDIGITLLESFLMKPLKSISGVLVAGDKEVFVFDDSYPFCSECRSRSCQERIKTLFGESRSNRKKGVV
ncbi:MAG: vitamin B12 dependent-methionine synthase activation domain-containing protein [Candidatus Zixiibacteriota bacterium]